MTHVARAAQAVPAARRRGSPVGARRGRGLGSGDTLGLSHAPAAGPREDAVAASARTPAPVPPLASLVVPDEPRLTKAAAAVADAVVFRGLPRPVRVPAPQYAVGRLAWDPHTGPAQVTAEWAYRTFSGDPTTVAAIGQAMALSRQAVTKGLYIGPYADRSVRALGLEPPPMDNHTYVSRPTAASR
ncbi:hypothetical protein ACLQ24_08225 [Micromonospora sp. DT4]|uniref:hypothetical protein n=1 Tax=Micromonospora sp. DT4 TaxID=3393438 RepID=UPI003CF4C8BE